MVLASRRKRDNDSTKRASSPPSADREVDLFEQRELISRLSDEGLELLERYFEGCERLDALGRLYATNPDDKDGSAELEPLSGPAPHQRSLA